MRNQPKQPRGQRQLLTERHAFSQQSPERNAMEKPEQICVRVHSKSRSATRFLELVAAPLIVLSGQTFIPVIRVERFSTKSNG